MAAKALPSQELLLQLLRYEPETGKLFWRERTPDMFRSNRKEPAEISCRKWNTKNAGRPAFNFLHPTGYFVGKMGGTGYRAHRLIWKMVYGSDPDVIDHVNGDPQDNRIENLRSVAHTKNCQNSKLSTANKSGVPGVFWFEQSSRWHVYINGDGKRVHVGCFRDFTSAVSARKKAELDYGYHANHGKRQ
jgi:hypothetical protein